MMNITGIRAAAVFSDGMVLQRGKPIAVFGYGDKDGAQVTAEMDGKSASARVRGGRWQVFLPAFEAGEGFSLVIRAGGVEQRFEDIAVGEVWLAGGQSNMEFELGDCTSGKVALQQDKNPRVRYYYTEKRCWMDDEFYENEKDTAWSFFGGEYTYCWSSAAYFFAKQLSERLNVTVGIIGCLWGGTSASAWMDKAYLAQDTELQAYIDDYEKQTAGKTDEELNCAYQEYLAYHEAWEEKSAAFYRENPAASWDECLAHCGENRYPGPMAPMNPYHAGALYEAMVLRVCPYTIKGFIWYQGESDDHRPALYHRLMTKLIGNWRDAWGDSGLPFIQVQLPMHRYEADPDTKSWCLIREAQAKTRDFVNNVAMAVILDCGAWNDIHPKDKKPVGERLALLALADFYGFGELKAAAHAPEYRAHVVQGSSMVLFFVNNPGGFDVRGEPEGFELAGADGEFFPATPHFEGETITLTAKAVPEPLYARYLWSNYAPVHVYGKNGLPLAGFKLGEGREQKTEDRKQR